MGRQKHIVSRRDWDIIVSTEDGDIQDSLAADLDGYTPGAPNVAYTTDPCGHVDSESSPRPTDEPTDEERDLEAVDED